MSEADERDRVLTDEERLRAVREQLKSLHAFDLAYEMMISLVSFGYQKLGLTGETAELRDLDDAHYAIELLGAILKVSDREHPVSDLQDLHSTLAQMQLGYVQALELQGGRPEPPAAAAEASGQAEAVPPEPPGAETPEPPATHEATPEEVEAHLAADAEAAATGEPAAPAATEGPAVKKAAAKKAAVRKPTAKKTRPKADDAG
jgi:hypothetical protein